MMVLLGLLSLVPAVMAAVAVRLANGSWSATILLGLLFWLTMMGIFREVTE